MLSQTLLVLLCTVTTMVPLTSAHMWLQCPEPRQCFYESPLSSTKGDGEWRTAPCPFDPDSSRATLLVAGAPTCIRVHEFVDHPGYIEVWLADRPVSPGDAQSSFSTRLAYVDDSKNGTSYQNIPVVVPNNVTCTGGSCTLQVRQWADDFKWYYYACADVRIVSQAQADLEGASAEDTCQSRILAGACTWESGPMRVRIMILQAIILPVGPIVFGVGAVVVVLVVYCRRRKAAPGAAVLVLTKDVDPAVAPNDTISSADEEAGAAGINGDGENATAANGESTGHWLKPAAIPVAVLFVVFVVLYLVVTGIVISQLKQCNYSGARSSEIKK